MTSLRRRVAYMWLGAMVAVPILWTKCLLTIVLGTSHSPGDAGTYAIGVGSDWAIVSLVYGLPWVLLTAWKWLDG